MYFILLLYNNMYLYWLYTYISVRALYRSILNYNYLNFPCTVSGSPTFTARASFIFLNVLPI